MAGGHFSQIEQDKHMNIKEDGQLIENNRI